jgi:hypothetical protein
MSTLEPKFKKKPEFKDVVWTCHDCAISFGYVPKDKVSCWHNDFCQHCHLWKPVTEPRDFELKKKDNFVIS